MNDIGGLAIPTLRRQYLDGRLTPADLVARLCTARTEEPCRNTWITRLDLQQVMHYARALERHAIDAKPLYGIPFVIKDNIDLAGVPTSAGCPEFAYVPQRSAAVVERLIEAGALPLGKTNLDQFATGLVGSRSPYGPCCNSVDPNYVAGGSSSGSAVAVALGHASFALGTDTAGSGRIPAAFNNIVGLKPTLGRLSTRGIVPACRTLDTVSIFALTCTDAATVLDCAAGYDAEDPYSRAPGDVRITGRRVGVPRTDDLCFFGDADYAALFDTAVQTLESLGFTTVKVDMAPFIETARLLYEGPWIAERYAAVGDFLAANPSAALPITREIIETGRRLSASQAFQGQYRLAALKRSCETRWSEVDFLLTPTAGTIYSLAAVEAEPLQLNVKLGYYTNYVNLLDLAAVAVPAGFRGDGLPFGVSLIGPTASERELLRVGAQLHPACVTRMGATQWPLAVGERQPVGEPAPATEPHGSIAVCGAHMRGLPLNGQLLERGAYYLQTTRTAPRYRLFALAGGPPHRPGLLRVAEHGAAIEVELWSMPQSQLGSFLAAIPAPLAVGTLELEHDRTSLGFLCEAYAVSTALDITDHGGWRAFLRKPGNLDESMPTV